MLYEGDAEEGLLSIIIPNWNGLRYLPVCLASLQRQDHAPLEIFVVDNASQDGSCDYLRSEHPRVKLLELAQNRGFTGACNEGLRAARGEFLALLNNDTEVDERWAGAVVAAMKRHPEVGSIASKMLLYDRRDVIHTAGDYFTRDGCAGNRGVWERDQGQYEREEWVFSACGGAAVYRRSMLCDIGLLDDDFFFSGEDVDLGWRAQLRGWRCLYVPQAVVYHHLSASGGGVTASYYDGRNSIAVLIKNLPAALWWRYGAKIIWRQCRRAGAALRSWRGAEARAQLRGMMAGLLWLPKMLRKRREVQASRRVGIEELEQLLTP
ncbi:MAG: glycosyltransferase family 2 protein [Anaerolineaceae bacterium]|nr:glycosyltransferase family 2 protein [Anaerolineaceae bacterium]